MPNNNTVYLAGKITGEPRYKEIFAAARERLEAAGFVVLDPSLLPASGFAYDAYIRISTAMMDECAAACFLHNWQDSKGARYEYERAAARKMPVFFFEEWEREKTAVYHGE